MIFWLRLLGVCFSFIVTSLIGFVLILVRWRDLSLNHYYGQTLRFFAEPLSGIKADVVGWENWHAHQPCIYAVNHQSNLDTVPLSGVFPKKTLLIGKKELVFVPFFGLYYYGAGNILIDRNKRTQAIAGLDQAVKYMKEKGASIWIFPEGTRNTLAKGKGHALLPFKKGAFYMAIQAGVPIVPIVSARFDGKFDWKKKLFRAGKHRIAILPPISTAGMTKDDVDRLSAITRQKMLDALRDFGDDRILS